PAAFTFAVPSRLAIPGGLKLGDQARLLELRDGTQHLAHEDGSRRVLKEKIGGGCRDEVDPESLQHVMSGELHGQITGEAVGALNQDDTNPIAGDPLQHSEEARALTDRIGTADRRVIELGRDLIAIRLCETLDGSPLPALAVFVGADI